MNLLLDDRFAPVTSEIGFLECDPATCADKFISWQSPLHAKRGVSLVKQSVSGNLEGILSSLFPLTNIERRRYLFVPTRSKWTAYFDNGWTGGDPASTVSYLAGLIGCRGIRAVCVANTITRESKNAEGQYGAVIFELYSGANRVGGNTRRSIYVSNDGGKWVFGAHGEQLEFEQPESYRAKRVQEKFPPELLTQYLNALGIDIFSEAFYVPEKSASLVTKTGPQIAGVREYDFATMQSSRLRK
jgi:hypothetical protein